MTTAGLTYERFSRDVMEAFSHDPAAILGHTKRSYGYRAVEDIHYRLQRQREILQEFIHSGNILDDSTLPKDVFKEPLDALKHSLDALEVDLQAINERAKHVSEVLKTTQGIHASVKADYNETLAHTSVIYPEVCCTHRCSSISVELIFTSVVAHCRSGRKLQRPVPTLLGDWYEYVDTCAG